MVLETTFYSLYRFLRWDLYSLLHFALRTRAKNLTSTLSHGDKSLVKQLKQYGFAKTSLAELQLDSNPLLEKAKELGVPLLERSTSVLGSKAYINRLTEEEVLEAGFLDWGLDERLLSIATEYLNTPVTFRGVGARRDDPDGKEVETRVWHRDPEDWKVLKVIVYLNDVGEEDGPFECLPKKYTWRLDWMPKDKKGRLKKFKFLERAALTQTGPAGTVIFVDTCRVYHRGRVNTQNSRFALFYSYLPSKPSHPEMCEKFFSSEKYLSKVNRPLSALQLSSLEILPKT